ncbi:MAG TPA: MFS transporter, partial [Chitinophagaceae bacterium]|nr:MFS transporter [Chitinophagaceae bacterium]
ITVTTGEMLTMSFLSAYWMGRTTPFNRGQYASLYTSGWSVAQVLGPGIGALIAQHYGFTSLWGITGTICIVSALGYRGLLWKESAV